MNVSLNKLIKAISIFLLVAFLSLFIYASFFVHPIADDFAYLSTSRIETYSEFLYNQYFVWSGGRYSSNTFWYFNPYKYGLNFYQLASIAVTLSLFIGHFLLITSLIKDVKKPLLFNISLLLTALTLYNLPNIAEGIYWYTGAITYTFASSLTLVFFACVIFYLRRKYLLKRVIHLTILVALSIVIIGFNEVLSLFIILVLFIASIISWYNKIFNYRLLFVLLVITTVCFIIILISPGSANRADVFENNKELINSIAMASIQTLRFLAHFISVPLLIVSFLYIGVHRKISETNIIFKQTFYVSRWVSLFLLVFIIFIATFLPYYATGILGQHRTVNLAYIFFIPLWFINLSCWINYWRIRTLELSPSLKIGLVILFFLGLFFTSNGYDLLNDIAYKKLNQFDKQMKQRYQLIEEHKKDSTIRLEFPAIENPPKTIFVLDIQEDSTNWINTGSKQYFKTNQYIRLKNPPLKK